MRIEIAILSIFFIIISILSLCFNILHPLSALYGRTVYYTNVKDRIIFGLMELSIGIALYAYQRHLGKQKIIEFSKCPRCKEVFHHWELKDGKCKNCKNTYTIDLEKYFKKYPNELEDDTKVYKNSTYSKILKNEIL